MAGFKIEQNVCTGRGFAATAANGFAEKFRTWAKKALVDGGPGWYEHDATQVAAGTNPYLVVSSHNAAGPNTPAKYIQLVIPTATSGRVHVFMYLYWDPVLHVGRGMYAAHNIPTLDSADFVYDFRGGPECLMLQSLTTTTWDGVFVDEFTPDANLIDSALATVTGAHYVNAGTHQVKTLDITGGNASALVDANGKCYVSIVFVSGVLWRIDIYNDSSRSGGNLVARSGNFTGISAGTFQSISCTQQNSSGLTIGIYIQGTTAADASIVWAYNKITVNTGEGAQFTVGNYYFIYDLTLQSSVNSVLIVSKSGDVLTVDKCYLPFPAGAKIGSYPHPFYSGGVGTALKQYPGALPYYNVQGTGSTYWQGSSGGCPQSFYDWVNVTTSWTGSGSVPPISGGSTDDKYLLTMSPDRRGRYMVQRPGIYEVKSYNLSTNASAYDGKTGYGQAKNVILGVIGTMSPNLHGRTLGGIDYTYFRTASSYMETSQSWAFMFRETQSNS